MTKVGDRAGPGTGGWDGTPGGRALSHGLLGKLNTWPSTVPPATPNLMKEQDVIIYKEEFFHSLLSLEINYLLT